MNLIAKVVKAEGQTLLGWRDVPTDLTGLGQRVIETMPVMKQAIVVRNARLRDQDAFERKILTIRKQVLNNVRALADRSHLPGVGELYMPSFSTRTVVYKGLLLATQVGSFIIDSYRHEPDLMKVIIVEVTRAANSFGRLHLEKIREAYAGIAGIVEVARAEGTFKRDIDSEFAAMFFYGAIEQLLTGWIFGLLPDTAEEFERAKSLVVEAICGGLETSDPAGSTATGRV